jgi:CTP:molybdopterin cytidylyltransferase MocA
VKTVGILLLAGGGSLRMLGPDKVLEQVRGLPLLTDRAIMCLETQADQVVVVTAPDKPDRRIALKNLDVEIVENGGSFQGMSHSLQVGLRHITADAVLIMLTDLPDITSDDLNKIIDHAKSTSAPIVRGTTQNGTPGHPVLIKRALFDEFSRLEGDKGAVPILTAHKDSIDFVALTAEHATADLDTPEAWIEWRSKN